MKLVLKLTNDKIVGKIHEATCKCAVALTPNVDACDDSDEDLPVTSLPCKWKPPRKRKHQALQVSKACFEYGKASKYSMQLLENYYPRPEEFRNTSAERLPQLLADIKASVFHYCWIYLLVLKVLLSHICQNLNC